MMPSHPKPGQNVILEPFGAMHVIGGVGTMPTTRRMEAGTGTPPGPTTAGSLERDTGGVGIICGSRNGTRVMSFTMEATQAGAVVPKTAWEWAERAVT